MKRIVSFFVLGAALSVSAALDPGNPYTTVASRNVFGLLPIPVGPPPDTTPAIPPPKITPNGIMNIFGKLQVLFKAAGQPKPGQPPKEESYVMSERERQDEIEVVKIDEKNSLVTFNNHGTIQELPLANAPNISTPPAGSVPISAPANGPLPGINPRGAGGLGVSGGAGRFGAGRTAATPSNSNGAAGASAAQPTSPSGPASQIYSPAAEAPDNLTAEQRIVLQEAQRLKMQEEGNPIAPMLPPTSSTPPPGQ